MLNFIIGCVLGFFIATVGFTGIAKTLDSGIETMKTECSIYKERGFKYLYLEQAHLYKSEIDGFEILGPLE
mgnify:CR=1 FL=1